MDEVQPTTAHKRVAVECLTLWMEPDRVGAALHIALLKQDSSEADEMIAGLLNLSHNLLVKLAKERGATPFDLREKAGEILSSRSNGSTRHPAGSRHQGGQPLPRPAS